jgi:nicotinamide riboside kinase
MLPELATSSDRAVFAIVGAESTGKSTLAAALSQRVAQATGLSTTWVPEVLREWCDAAGRTPHQNEQAGIATEQARRIGKAAQQHTVVICDTTPLMTAVYHHQVFGDHSLDAAAARWQQACTLTLLTALDLPWQADGLQRDGPQVRVPVDTRLRELLVTHALPFTVIAGTGTQRVDAALDALSAPLRRLAVPGSGLFTRLRQRDTDQPAWPWQCERCDLPACEHALARRDRQSQTSLHGG